MWLVSGVAVAVAKASAIALIRPLAWEPPNSACEARKSFFLFLFRAAPMAYGGSQAGGQIRATAASYSHSHAGSEPHL